MNDTPGWVSALFFAGFVLFPLLIAYLGVNVVRGALRFRKHGVGVMGTVVEVKTIHHVGEAHDMHRYSYQPIFEFEAPDGTMLRGEAGSYGYTDKYPAGTQREILVDFAKPEMVFMSKSYRLYFGLFMIVFGLAFGGFALFALTGGLGG
jgi:hypothetical protein